MLKSGSGRGAVGTPVASNTRDPWFESSHWQILFTIKLYLICFEKTKLKIKEAGNGPLKFFWETERASPFFGRP